MSKNKSLFLGSNYVDIFGKKINKYGFKFIWICLRFKVNVENIEINL